MPLGPPIRAALALSLLMASTAHAQTAPSSTAADDVPGPGVIPSPPRMPLSPRANDPPTSTTTPVSPPAYPPIALPPPELPEGEEEQAYSVVRRRAWQRPDVSYSGSIRSGLYADGDKTTVFRALAAVGGQGRNWSLNGSASVDVVSSASIDVRSSPLGKVDVVSGASGRSTTSGGSMSDRRIAATLGTGWKDERGHAASANVTYANETDYNSVGAGVSGSYDLAERTVTLLGGLNMTRNWVASTLDKTFARDLWTLGWTAGVAPVLSPRDVLRLRYDGGYASGYQGSPYRYVRFGDWKTSTDRYGTITFSNTVGSTSGALENVPDLRHRHALVLEWLHALGTSWAVATQLRGSLDSWGVDSVTAGLELRYGSPTYRFRVGYRFYGQSGADFYQSKYTQAQSAYPFFTSDKELSKEWGHIGHLGMSWVLARSRGPGDSALLLDAGVNVLHYQYPDFVLLASRTSGWFDLGLTWEL